MEKQIREDKVLEFKALCMTKKVFDQLVKYTPGETLPTIIGWVNATTSGSIHDIYIAEVNGALVCITHGALWEHYFAQRPTLPDTDPDKSNKTRLWVDGKIVKLMDSVPQIFIK